MADLTPETIKRFKQMFKKEYDVEYSDSEAWEATHNLLSFFDLLLKEDRKQNPENYKKKINGDKQGVMNIQTKSDKMVTE